MKSEKKNYWNEVIKEKENKIKKKKHIFKNNDDLSMCRIYFNSPWSWWPDEYFEVLHFGWFQNQFFFSNNLFIFVNCLFLFFFFWCESKSGRIKRDKKMNLNFPLAIFFFPLINIQQNCYVHNFRSTEIK